ncbi:MAG: DUF3305 domain-containing protein [Gammaproteobacteria bacterium]
MSVVLDIPVTVIMERKQVSRGRWSVPSWQAAGVVAGGSLASSEASGTPLRSNEDGERFLWGGVPLELHSDWAENYRYNLIGEKPRLFVICSEKLDGELCPVLVTANHDEACSHLEGDDQVFATPIPPEIYKQLERFVVEYCAPQRRRKRKRKNWSEPAEK